MSEFAPLLRAVAGGESLSAETMRAAIGALMDESWSAAQAGAFLAALATKGETADELVGAAAAMRERSLHVDHALPVVVDTCGTGGDGAGTINISTAVGFVVASCGIPVAKHGGRAASSKCGSADVLEALGVPIDDGPEAARRNLERNGFTFMFAPSYHPAMKVVAPIRRELGIRTLFNLLGPISNPARATHQVIGVATDAHVELIGEALRGLGAQAGAVVHAVSGLDEVAGDGPTQVFQFGRTGVRRYRIDPAEFGIHAPNAEIAGGDAATNAAALRAILAGERSPRADLVALNAGLALVVAEQAETLSEGLATARRQLAEGAALAVFERACRPREEAGR
ncbi:MAG: anthranilate phosphoribosyltransferase [Vulcanimicrobiaceae bacterium]